MTEMVLLAQVHRTIAQLHSRYPRLSAAELQLIGQTMMGDLATGVEAPHGLLDKEAALYTQYYTDAELQEMISFFRRPAGQSMLLEGPQIEHSLEQTQRKWAASLAGRIFADVRAKIAHAGYPDLSGR
ncbi:MAG: DUF2059 domain-containing protein [Gammaproteobacteria bacterium]|nr:DUF2059 domain-containing protein [Gammaproteobacteria bacterium]